ncbi:MAG: RNA methyltransferase [Deltaproteobacteria bacterium]|nr:RNA methyltransferase [Deltaproteobacteria bacterium]MBW2696004.1 RNA methyltransferase [Deltaproteobacteria bacterium]
MELLSPIPIDALDDPRVEGYADLKDRNLRKREGLFVVEGRVNLRCLIERSPHRPLSLLVSPAAHAALADVLEMLGKEVPVYLASHEVLKGLVGFKLHRGCLALCARPDEPSLEQLVAAAPAAPAPSLLVVLEELTNHDNVGGVFRNAMAFGADAVVLCPRTCDPLYRKAIRTSMGGTLCVEFARAADWPGDALTPLRAAGYQLVALDPGGERLESGDVPLPPRTALILGTEGAGLSDAVLEAADIRLRIDMASEVDSLNVATAAAIAMHHFFDQHADGGTPA